ncbi:hypothetical protein ATANTOWER_014606 [Ataeniobius toweri]|uniref:Uncharacterized protein n=1 Tax=Ataeniobius toweri TaxID=208326 RepID=A0ABU7CKE8_9TELE|nr:hypothetical protein [Ataeniobius toweri]
MPTVVVTHFRLNFSQRRNFRLLPAFFCLPRLRISKMKRFKYQRVSGTTSEHCCVPLCQASGEKAKTAVGG